jgi:tRNA U34 5-methylaminomethyl-2-thiouridine-forming methyltransferase MnmC
MPVFRVAEESVSDHICEHARVGNLGELSVKRLPIQRFSRLHLAAEFHEPATNRSGGLGVHLDRRQLLDHRHAEWLLLNEASKPNPREPLEHQVRRSILLAYTGTNKAQPGDGAQFIILLRLEDPWLWSRDAEHPILIQRVGKHRPVAGLKDPQRQQRIREEKRARENHHGHFRRQVQFLMLDTIHGNGTLDCTLAQTLRIAFDGGYLRAMRHPEPLPFELVVTPSGTCTLRALEEGETFHPGIGPKAEAEAIHVNGQQLAARAATCSTRNFVIWDVGLGGAANAIAAIEAVAGAESDVELHSFECDLRSAHFACDNAAALGYFGEHAETLRRLIREGTATSGNVSWHLHQGDFTDPSRWHAAPRPDAILYDPYSPRRNPALWTMEHFRALRTQLQGGPACTMTSYSRSSAVRVTLLLAGFYVGFGPATGEKDQTTVASTSLDLLTQPLDARWLERVRRSTAAAPLRIDRDAGPINADDWEALIEHPQFTR